MRTADIEPPESEWHLSSKRPKQHRFGLGPARCAAMQASLQTYEYDFAKVSGEDNLAVDTDCVRSQKLEPMQRILHARRRDKCGKALEDLSSGRTTPR